MARKKKKNLFHKLISFVFFCLVVYFGVNALSYADTLKFAQISDAHVSNKKVDTSYKILASSKPILADVINQINAMSNIDFVMVTGDLVDLPSKTLLQETCEQMNKLKSPWYFAFGNHDAGFGFNFDKNSYFSQLKKQNKNMVFEKTYYSFIPQKGYRVIVLDATIDTRLTSNGELPKEQLAWLDLQLSECESENEVPLIFLHHPLHEPFPSFHHRIINANDFKNTLLNHKIPIAIFSGHYHAARIYKEDNILHVSTPSLVTYPCAYRIVSVNNMKTKVVFTFDFRETNLKDAQKKAKLMTFSSGTYKGEDSDRNIIITLDK